MGLNKTKTSQIIIKTVFIDGFLFQFRALPQVLAPPPENIGSQAKHNCASSSFHFTLCTLHFALIFIV